MSSIKVAVRCRPLFDGERPVSGLDVQNRRILLDNKAYDPDYTFAQSSSQDDVFQICKPILDAVKEGGGTNGTIMVYGQTGTGKTYTMLGHEGRENGLVHKVIGSMLEHVQAKTMSGSECALTLSMIEIYNEKLTDMLSPNGSDEITLIGGFPRFTQKVALCRLEDASQAVSQGLSWRRTASTMMNERSSRSHVVFIVDYEEVNPYTNETDVSHLFLVDLAGSESLKKSQAVGATATEAGKINRSLLALKNVFLALSNTNEANRPSHVPYRDSRLTELLQDSIGGTARTLLIACISAVGRDLEETKSTLMYAVKARSIRNATNSEREKLLLRLRSMEVENQRLRNRLEDRVAERGGYMVSKEEHVRYQELEVEVEELRSSVAQLVKDSQTINARQHILDAKAKMLQATLDEKEAELQRLKLTYQEAMKKFEEESRQLQRAVQTAVGAAKHTAEHLSESQYAVLEGWRKALEVAATQPPLCSTLSHSSGRSSFLDATPKGARGSFTNEEEGSTAINSPNPRVAGSTPPLECSRSIEMVEEASSSSSPLCPAAPPLRTGPLFPSHKTEDENENDEGDEEREQQQPAMSGSSRSGRPPPLVLPSTAAEALMEADATCERVLGRVYGAFYDILTALHREKTAFQDRLHQLQEDRRSKVAELTDELQRHVAQSVQKLVSADERSEREVKRAEDNWASQWSSAVGPNFSTCFASPGAGVAPAPSPSTAALHALQHVARDVCHTISRSALSTFPSTPDPPVELVAALQKISLTGEQQIIQSTARQMIGPLASLGPLAVGAGAVAGTVDGLQSSPRVSDSSSMASAHSGGSAGGGVLSSSTRTTMVTGSSARSAAGPSSPHPNTHHHILLRRSGGHTAAGGAQTQTRASMTAPQKNAGPPSARGAVNFAARRGNRFGASAPPQSGSARVAQGNGSVWASGHQNYTNGSRNASARTGGGGVSAGGRERESRLTGTSGTSPVLSSRRSTTPVQSSTGSSRHRGPTAGDAVLATSPTAVSSHLPTAVVPGSKRRRSDVDVDGSNESLARSPGQTPLTSPAPARTRRRQPSAPPLSDTERVSGPLRSLCGNTTASEEEETAALGGRCGDSGVPPLRRSPSPTPSTSSSSQVGGRRGVGPRRAPVSRKPPTSQQKQSALDLL